MIIAIARKAFISSLPVLMGYSAMGFAAGVLLTGHGGLAHPVLWGALSSMVCISGALQFMIADWVHNGTALRDAALLTLCLNIRYAMYGFSLLERFRDVVWYRKLYLIWSLTDETYALETECRLPGKPGVLYCTLLSAMNHLYWAGGVTAGALAGKALPFDSEGIDFAMTALFIVILTDLCREKANRLPALIGGVSSLLMLMLFGPERMLILSMAVFIPVFLFLRPGMKKMENSGGVA